jgi:uncharacterized protein YbaR (Trm112 family)
VRVRFCEILRCAVCGEDYRLGPYASAGEAILEGALECRCAEAAPVIGGIPRILPRATTHTLVAEHADFYRRHPQFLPSCSDSGGLASIRTLHAFGDEWKRFPELLEVHRLIFDWYFEGPAAVHWRAPRARRGLWHGPVAALRPRSWG